jgi:HSP20 family molecular chaperone IbpA
MALLPARRDGTVARPGSQAVGVLTVTVPKAEIDKPPRIDVTAG